MLVSIDVLQQGGHRVTSRILPLGPETMTEGVDVTMKVGAAFT